MSAEALVFASIVAAWTALTLPALASWVLGRDYFGRWGGQPLGRRVPGQLGWFLMELPALVVLPAVYLTVGERHAVGDVLVAAWVAHYAHRGLIWPWLAQRGDSSLPAITCAAGFGFNVVNGLFFGWFLTRLANYPADWFTDIRFIVGAAAMLAGASLNIWSDHYLAGLRRRNPNQRVLPHSGAFRFVSCPNLAGEIVEWAGFALMTWSLPGLSFALWTTANLLPRALWRHRWYRENFDDFPETRKAIIPKLV